MSSGLEEDLSAIALKDLFSSNGGLDVSPVGVTSGLRLRQPPGDLVSDSVLSVSQSLGLVVSRGVEVHAVSAGVALDVLHAHGLLSGRRVRQLAHRSVLPRIFAAVEEEDVVALDLEAAVVLVGLRSPGPDGSAEDTLAVVWPEGGSERLVAHGLLDVGGLEETELSAVLVGPLTQARADVDGGPAQGHGIVLVVADTSTAAESSNSLKKGFSISGSLKLLAHGDTSAILDTHHEDVSEVEPEVTLVDRDGDAEGLGDLLGAFFGFEGAVSGIDGLHDSVGASRV